MTSKFAGVESPTEFTVLPSELARCNVELDYNDFKARRFSQDRAAMG